MATATVTTAMESVASQTFTVESVKKGKSIKKVAAPTADVLALVKRAVELDKRAKAATAELKAIKKSLGTLMADQGIDQFEHAGIVRVSRSVSTPNRLDTEAFEAAHPGLLDTYKRPGAPEERLTVK